MSGSVTLTRLQEAARDHILSVLKEKRQAGPGPACYLLADEVGLGKTKIAAAVINALSKEKANEKFVVYYLCGNQRVTDQNIQKLQKDCRAVETKNERLSMQLRRNYQLTDGRNTMILPLTPATTFTNKNSTFNKEEMEFFCENLLWTKSNRSVTPEDSSSFLLLRQSACQIVMTEQLKPDLVLLDEFQNYDSLLYQYRTAPYPLFETMLQQAAYVLLLSATPYQMLTEEIRGLRYRDVLAETADAKDTNLKKQNEEEEADAEFCSNNESFDRLVNFILRPLGPSTAQPAPKGTDLYRQVFCRTERSMFYDTEIKDEQVEEHTVTTAQAAANIGGLRELADLVRREKGLVNDSSLDRLVAYEKKAPNFPCFSTRYTNVKGIIENEAYCQAHRESLRQLAGRSPDSQAKYALLKEHTLPAGADRMLWIPPVIWDLPEIPGLDLAGGNPFLHNRDYTKTLVFGDYRMSTAAPALYLTREALRRQASVTPVPAKELTEGQKAALGAYYEDCFTAFPPDARARAKRVLDRYLQPYVGLIRAVTGVEDPEAARWYYAAMGCLKNVLEEYCVIHDIRTDGPAADARELLSALDSYQPTKVLFFPETEESLCGFAERFTEDSTDTNAHSRTHTQRLKSRFNSPFYPFVMTASSVAQEGLDFHFYSHAIAHWSVPKTPVEFMQREGRIDRYCSHLVRKRMQMLCPQAKTFRELQETCPALPEKAGRTDYPETRPLFPWWYIGEKDFEVLAKGKGEGPLPMFRRLVCVLPLSSEYVFWRKLRQGLANYNVRLGPSYQSGTKAVRNFCPLLHQKT